MEFAMTSQPWTTGASWTSSGAPRWPRAGRTASVSWLVAVLVLLCAGTPGSGAESALDVDAMCELVRRGTLEQFEAAIRDGGDLRGTGTNQRTVLMEAVMWSTDPGKVEALLKAGADPNTVGWYGRTALMWTGWSAACRPGTVAVLRSAGADVGAVETGGGTALHAVIFDGDRPEIVAALIAAGIDIQRADKEGWTALDRARERNRVASTKLLLDAGAKAGTAMWAILQTGSPAAVRELVVRTGLKLNAEEGRTRRIPIVEAMSTISDPEVVEVLLELGADVNMADAWGYTPLLRAVMSTKNPAVITALIRGGANVAVHKKGSGETAVMLAVQCNENRADVVTELLKAHADVAAKDSKGRTALDYATENPGGSGMAAVLTALRDAGAHVGGSFWTVVERGGPEAVAAAIAAGADVNARDENTRTVLMWAMTRGRGADVIAVLLRAQANVNAADRWGTTALMSAQRDVGAVDALIAAGADLGARDAFGRTALHHAVMNPVPAVITALLRAGGDPELQDRAGSSARDLARERGVPAVIALLAATPAAEAIQAERSRAKSDF